MTTKDWLKIAFMVVVLVAWVGVMNLTAVVQVDREYIDLERRIRTLENANLQVEVAVMRSQLDSIIKMLWVLFGAATANVVQLLWQFMGLMAKKRLENGK